MFSGLLPGAKEKAVRLNRSGAHKGDEKVKFHPTLRCWAHTPTTTLVVYSNYQVLPPSTVNTSENKEITSYRGPMSILQGPI